MHKFIAINETWSCSYLSELYFQDGCGGWAGRTVGVRWHTWSR